jgi:ribonuclease HII
MITVGIDEVGRGCWAGPVVSGAVILSDMIDGLKDSKKLSSKKRTDLSNSIQESAIAFGLGWVSPSELDHIGLTEAVRLSMYRALAKIEAECDEIIIDGSYNFMSDNPKAVCIIKADDSVPCVSAASILAKVARDDYMTEQAKLYPDYGFESHVGYGTKRHLENLQKFGICKIHRLSYKPIQLIINAQVLRYE